MKISSAGIAFRRLATQVTGAAYTGTGPAESVSLLGDAYYDAKADAAAQQSYYAGLPDPDKTHPARFYRKLQRLLTDTHTRHTGYNPSRYLYDWVDLRPNLRLQSIYDHDTTDVGAAVRVSSVTDYVDPYSGQSVERQAQRWGAALAEGPTDALSIARKIVEIETRNFFNCEHAVPRIWYEDDPIKRGDLHILFTCESEANEFRSSKKYFDFPDLDPEPGDQGGFADERRFEPAGGKGAVARAVLYYMVRYGTADVPYGEDDLKTLLEWNRRYPPDLYERHRNQAIADIQGNRNPFIDHPEWAEKIRFPLFY